MTDSLIREFVREQRELLDLELNSEQDDQATNNSNKNASEDANTLGQKTVALRNLEACGISVGLYGRTVVELTVLSKDDAQKSSAVLLPAHRFTVGDDVEIHSKQDKKGKAKGGVISAVTDTSISVALFQKNNANNNNNNKDDNAEDEDIVGTPPLTLIPKSSVEVHRKLVAGLAELERHGANHPIAGTLIQALFGPPTSKLPSSTAPLSIEPFNDNLDESQLEAISFALERNRPVALIHGPPGTGKTTTVAELIQQAVHVHGMKVLVATPSNVAVDNVLERLVANTSTLTSSKKRSGGGKKANNKQKPLKMVRLGHPARIKPSILPYSLEALVQSHDGTEIVKDVRTELQSFLRILTNPKSRGNDKRMAYREVKSLRKEVRMREEKVVKELISQAQVVLATTVGASSRLLNAVTDKDKQGDKAGFDLVIIDEAAQALEASCWIPILKGRKLVLAGDHCQLPPTIMCRHSKVQAKLGKTLFERLMELYGDKLRASEGEEPQVSRMLKVQYRMHETIANWASKASYHGGLLTHDSVRHRTIAQLLRRDVQDDKDNNDEAMHDDDISEVAMLLVDTAGCDMFESESSSGSRFNEGEAQLVAKHVRKLLELGMRQEQIAIITPYNGQVELLRTTLLPDNPKLEIRSVDGFQGGEREAVVLSLVRSSQRGGGKKGDGIGFLRDNRRLNVAVTRAKRHCAVICDTETVTQSKFLKDLITWMEEHGEQRSAMEFLSDSNEMDNDLRDAEKELQKAMAELAKSEKKAEKEKKSFQPNKTDDAAKRKELLDKIASFAESGKQGEEMALSSELTSFDRRVVHEFAESIPGLGHRSEGIEGIDRRIILVIERATPVAVIRPKVEEAATNEAAVEENLPPEPMPAPSTAFAALAMDDDSDSDPDNDDAEKDEEKSDKPVETSNNLLADLAKERALRAKQQQKQANPQAQTVSKSNKTKKKGNKLGGKAAAKKPKEDVDDGLDDLDDLAFLDKQINKVQTSHGRRVEGSGSSYKTIVNGILISKPAPREKPKNTRAANALQAKLKAAEGDRKAKPKKKK